MENVKIYLVRSPSQLIKLDQAGYGWDKINFSEAADISSLLQMFTDKAIDVGRKRNQIRRFFSIKKDDIVIVPTYRSFALGIATGVRSYQKGVNYGENRIGVEFLRHDDGTVVRIPRTQVPEALSTRLRIRMAIASLDNFKDDIHHIIDQMKDNGSVSFNSRVQALEEEAASTLKEKLLSNIRAGKTYLASGGVGLENLIAELLRTEGYVAKILGTRAFKGLADADIEAFREDRFSSSKLLIQVKHHDGNTGRHALDQLLQLDNEDDASRWLITTGDIEPSIAHEAETQGIGVIDGEALVEWLIERANLLSPITLNKLGLSTAPWLLI